MEERRRFVVPIAAETAPDADRLGQKGAGLVVMRRLGLPVPPGVILTTDLYRALYRDRVSERTIIRSTDEAGLAASPRCLSDALWAELWAELEPSLATLANEQRQAGGPSPPPLWAVRSGAPLSMPGMLDSILNLGLNPGTVAELAAWAQNRRFAVDCYRRFLRQYAASVLGVALLQRQRLGTSAQRADLGPDADELRFECAALVEEIRQRSGATVPASPALQLRAAVDAVLRSFMAPRARDYRRLTGVAPAADELGTAVVIQAMVFGNRGERSGTGVIFSRDPATGEPHPYGEYLPCAQGEDVVGGTAMPQPLRELFRQMPTVYEELVAAAQRLEAAAADLQDIEFTVEEGRLWLLQARSGKRSGKAMVRIAADLAREGLLSREAALLRIEPRRLGELLYPRVEPSAPRHLLGRGLPASPGVAIGRAVFSVADVEAHARAGTATILVRTDTSSDDIVAIQLAAGVLTSRGGMTSHAAVVARGLGRCAVVGASSITVDAKGERLSTREHTVRRGELLTLDGNSGEVLLGAMPLSTAHLSENRQLAEILSWSTRRQLRIYAVADSLADWQLCQQLGAQGVGLCRCESLLLAQPTASEAMLSERIAADLVERLSLLPDVEVGLRLFAPAAGRALLALGPSDGAIAIDGPFLGRARRGFLRGLLEAQRRLRAQGIDVAPQLLLPLERGDDASQSVAELAAELAALGQQAGLAREVTALPIGLFVSELASLRGALSGLPPVGLAEEPLVVLAVRSLEEVRAGLGAEVAAAKQARPGLRLGLCLLEGGPALAERAEMGFLAGLGLEFVACPPLRMAVAAVATAQAALAP